MKLRHSILAFVLIVLTSCAPVRTPAAVVPQPTLTPTPEVIPAPVCRNAECAQEGTRLDFLIVTRPLFLDALVPYIEWKTANSFRVGVVTVEWLDENYQGRHLAEKMKTGMHDLRKQTGLTYVLLVGDTQMAADDFSLTNILSSYSLSIDFNLPTGFYRRFETDPPQAVLPSDAYFVEDRDWDPDNTGLNPRPDNMETGEGKLDASLYLGRWSVRTPDQVTALAEKTFKIAPANNLFISADTSLADGVTTYCPAYPPQQYQEFSCYQDMWVTGRVKLFENNTPQLTTESLFVNVNDSQESAALMKKLLDNSGVMELMYHGNLDCIGVRGGQCVPYTEFQFKNVFPLMDMQACVVAAFYYPASTFSEQLALSPTGPILFTQSPNPVLFFEGLRDGKTAGEAFWEGAAAWLYYPNPILFLGDPSLKVFVSPEQ